ncbi:MAG: glycosyltransferase family 1 protein [Chloroflexi bacterium]|nr:glycosyltransferase family 1 protein [Chloroflexota bacterium]MDL1883330.1 glycosyltransferase family 4 protein [Anaerolineae bacterium CFX8]
MRVGFLASDLTGRHGWGSYSLNLIRALAAQGIELTILAARNSPPVDDLDIHPILPGVTPIERFFLPRLAAVLPRTRALLRGCDIIHAAIEPYAPLAAWAVGGRQLFITGHGSYVRLASARRWPASMIYRQTFRRGMLVCVSRYTASVAGEALPGVRTVVVNNGVEAGRFLTLERPPKAEKSAPLVLSVGAVKARKGTLELVRAMAVVRREIPAARCAIVGSLTTEPDYVTRVRAEIARLGLEGCIDLPGRVPEADLLDWYTRADVFVMPSINDGWKFEGYGLVYLEAGAAGLPVIGATQSGAEDAISDGVTGLLARQEHLAADLPELILRILRDRALAARMGAAGREKARAQTWARVAEQMAALYGAALQKSPG